MTHKIAQYAFILLILSAIAGGYFYFQSTAAQKINSSQTPKLTDGLVGYWTFDGADMSGDTVYDRAGSNNGTLTYETIGPKPAKTIGKIGQAIALTNSGDALVDISNITTSASPTTYSISVWIKPDSQSGTWDTGMIFGSSGNAVIKFEGSSRKINYRYNPGSGAANHYTNGTLSLGDWHHLVVTVNSGVVTYYLDGSADSNTYTGAVQMTVGVLGMVASNSFWGSMDEFRYYSRALSASEITELYQQGQTKINASQTGKLTDGLINYWTFNGSDVSGTTVTDKAGSSNGTLVNGPVPAIGRIGQGMDFQGGNDKMTFSGITLANTHTVSMWIYPKTSSDDFGCLFSQSDSKGLWYRGTAAGVNNGKLTYYYSNTDHFNNTPLANLAWSHVVVVNNAGSVTFYVNGQADGTSASALGYSPDNMGEDSSGIEEFKGIIDEVRVYNKALSQSEITELYQQGQTKINASQTGKLTDGLTWYWTMDGADVNWGTNTVTNKVSGGPSGTLVSMDTSSAKIGKIGQALDFDGVADYFSFSSAGMNGYGAISVSAWVNVDDWNSETASGVFTRNGSAAASPALYINPATGSISFYISTASGGNGDGILTTATAVPLGQWKHIVATWDGTNLYAYIDGTKDANTATTDGHTLRDTTSGRVGYVNAGEDQFFNGKIDEVRVYNKALSASEVTELYNQGR